MSELAMFNDEYAASLPLAPRIFHVDEMINTSYMPKPAGVWMEVPGSVGENEVSPEILLPPLGRVVAVLQVKKGGGGYVRARFQNETAKWLVEYHFKSNPRIN